MAYVEIRRQGELIARRWVDDEKARRGCGVQLGTLGSVHAALGQVVRLRDYEVRIVAGAPGEDQRIDAEDGEIGRPDEAVPEPAPEEPAPEEPPATSAAETAGLPLDRYVEQRRLSRRQGLELMAAVCRCVQGLHEGGAAHGGLRPANVLVGDDGRPHVPDADPAERDEKGQVPFLEAMAYASPEQAAGRLDLLGPRSDVYSLGVMLYRLLTGQMPLDLSGTRLDVIDRIMSGQIRPPREASRAVNRELEAVLRKAMTLAPDARYDSPGQLAEEIDRALQGLPLLAREPTRGYLFRRGIARHRAALLVTAGLAAVGLGAGAFWLTGAKLPSWRWPAFLGGPTSREATTGPSAEPLVAPAPVAAARTAAEAAWAKVADLDPGQGFGALLEAAKATRHGAETLLAKKAYAEAKRAYEELLARSRLLARRQEGRAAAVADRKRAQAAGRRARQAEPAGAAKALCDAAAALADKATIAFASGGFEEAQRHWKAAAAQYGQAVARAGGLADLAAARDAYRQARAGLNQAKVRRFGGALWTAAAEAARKAENTPRDPARAAASYRMAVDLLAAAAKEADFQGYLHAARRLEGQDKTGEALAEVKLALARRPSDPEALALKKRLEEAARPLAGGWYVLFDGKKSIDWQGGLGMFRVEGGAIVGGSLKQRVSRKAFLYGRKSYRDFELRLKVKALGDRPSGGILFRGRFRDAGSAVGYRVQVGVDRGILASGAVFDEGRTGKFLARPDRTELPRIWKPNAWNGCRIVCTGTRVRVWLNGRQTVDFTETRTDAARDGAVGVAIQPSRTLCEVWYKDILIREVRPDAPKGEPPKP